MPFIRRLQPDGCAIVFNELLDGPDVPIATAVDPDWAELICRPLQLGSYVPMKLARSMEEIEGRTS